MFTSLSIFFYFVLFAISNIFIYRRRICMRYSLIHIYFSRTFLIFISIIWTNSQNYNFYNWVSIFFPRRNQMREEKCLSNNRLTLFYTRAVCHHLGFCLMIVKFLLYFPLILISTSIHFPFPYWITLQLSWTLNCSKSWSFFWNSSVITANKLYFFKILILTFNPYAR